MGKSDHAFFRQDLFLLKYAAGIQTVQRQEGCPAVPVPFKMIDHLSRRLIGIRHDVLNTAAQGGFDRKLIFFFHLEQIRHHAENSRRIVLSFHDPADRLAIAFVPFRNIFQRFQTGFFPVKGPLPDLHLFVLLFQLGLQTAHL